MKILYVIYRENIFSPIVKSQVIDLLSKNSNKEEIHLLWIKRIDSYFRNRKKITETKKILKKNKIILHEIPFIVGRFPLTKRVFDFAYLQVKRSIAKIIGKYKIQIVQTRGYNAGLLITKIIKEYKLKRTAHIFDPRSPYLTEIQSTYDITTDSKRYNFWNSSEEYIFREATYTIATSNSFKEYVNSRGGKAIYIPNNSEIKNINIAINKSRHKRRNSICYVGSMGHGWNNVDTYINFIENIYKIEKNINYEFYILEQCIPLVTEKINQSIIPNSKIKISSVPPEKISDEIAGCLAGMQIMSSKDTRLGIKTVDYLSAGVPIICNRNAMGASDLVNKTGLGWNIDKIKIETIVELMKQNNLSEKCIKYAYDNFSTDSIALKYDKLYHNLTK
ncbi:hypothetical protein IKG31_00880 [Candidatus Saccharibacteria bacterium]|nr:hypothetical protein [Candidatus Saccharibacteria bacterium]